MEGAVARRFAELPQPIGIGSQQGVQNWQRLRDEAARTCPIGLLASTFRPSFLSRSYQRPEDGFGGDEAEGLVERQDDAAEWAGG